MKKEIPERVLCAAIWYKDGVERVHLPRNITTGLVVSGWRHCNCFTQLATIAEKLAPEAKQGKRLHVLQNCVQGFLTSKGNFINRQVALKMAIEQNQLIEEIRGTELYSENIY